MRGKIENTEVKIGESEFVFSEPFVQMGYTSRLIFRIATNAWFIIQTTATAIFLLSDIKSLFLVGVFSALILLDRLTHYKMADHSILDRHKPTRNIARYISPRTKRMLSVAHDKAILSGSLYSLHLIRVLADTSSVKEVLTRLEIEYGEFVGKLDGILLKGRERGYVDVSISNEIQEVVISAYKNRTGHQRFITPVDIFVELNNKKHDEVRAFFDFFEINPSDLRQAAVFGRVHEEIGFTLKLKTGATSKLFYPRRGKHRVMNRAWTARPTPTLDSLGIDLTDQARMNRIGFLVGHDEEYRRLIDVLSRPSKPNALLIGESGVGKRALAEHLAYMVIKDKTPPELFDKRVVLLDIGALVSGAEQSDIQGRARTVFDEVAQAGNVILFIPNIHTFLQTGGASQISAAENILPLIASGQNPVIGSTTSEDFKQFIEKNSLFREAFETIRVEEVTEEEAGIILSHEAIVLEQQYHVKVTFKAISTAVRIAERYFREKPLPTSAIDLLQEVLVYVRNRDEPVVSADDVISVAEERVNVPLHHTNKEEAETLLNLEDIIHKRYVDQEEAVKIVANSLRQYRSGLNPSKGPIGTFLFVGPTGVGKTELAKILADIQFGSEEAMLRFDMSEFQDEESIRRFIGSSDGSVGGSLTDAVHKNPYSLILLDEFEKAHRNILKLFLQVFDDGRLTDASGRTVNFENTIIIATSNAEASFIVNSLRSGKKMQDVRVELNDRLVARFSPELMNRFSGVVLFKSLSEEEIQIIARMHLRGVVELLKAEHNINLILDDDIVRSVAELGYDRIFGARPLERVISDRIRGPLSIKLLKGELAKGAQIKIWIEGENLGIYEIK